MVCKRCQECSEKETCEFVRQTPLKIIHLEDTDQPKSYKDHTYKIGYFVGVTIGLCVTACLIAGTIRFVMWLF